MSDKKLKELLDKANEPQSSYIDFAEDEIVLDGTWRIKEVPALIELLQYMVNQKGEILDGK